MSIYNIFLIGSITVLFHSIFKYFNIEKQMYEKYSIGMTRSLICGSIAFEAYNKYNYLKTDKCLDNITIYNDLREFHNMFLSYFIFDTTILFYQVYLRIENNIRLDLLYHHILAITALLLIEDSKMYGLSLMIGLSEGLTFVSGPKLLSVYYNNKYLTNFFIRYRLLYIIFVRILYLWPSLIYFYYDITTNCSKYKKDQNILMVLFMIFIIIHAEISWYYSGRKELARF